MKSEQDTITVQIKWSNSETNGGMVVLRLDETHFQLISEPFVLGDEGEEATLPKYKDVIEVEQVEDGVYRFLRVKERSPFRKINFLLSHDLAESPQLKQLLDELTEAGGYWEIVFGGMLILLLPRPGGQKWLRRFRELSE